MANVRIYGLKQNLVATVEFELARDSTEHYLWTVVDSNTAFIFPVDGCYVRSIYGSVTARLLCDAYSTQSHATIFSGFRDGSLMGNVRDGYAFTGTGMGEYLGHVYDDMIMGPNGALLGKLKLEWTELDELCYTWAVYNYPGSLKSSVKNNNIYELAARARKPLMDAMKNLAGGAALVMALFAPKHKWYHFKRRTK